MISIRTLSRVHFLSYLLNCNSLGYEIWSANRYSLAIFLEHELHDLDDWAQVPGSF